MAKVLPLPADRFDPAPSTAPSRSSPTNFNLLPTVSFVVPNQLHDMHDGSRKQGDDWLAANLNAYAVWARTNNSLLIVTWDEDDYNQDNEIPTVLYGANLRNGTVTPGTWTLHNLLRTIEDMYGSTNHAGAAAQVRSIVGPFTTDPALTVATFRQGLNGYGNARDARLREETQQPATQPHRTSRPTSTPAPPPAISRGRCWCASTPCSVPAPGRFPRMPPFSPPSSCSTRPSTPPARTTIRMIPSARTE